MTLKPWVEKYDPNVPRSIQYPDIPVSQFLSESAQQFPNRVSAIYGEWKFTYQQIDSLSTDFARSLVENGIKKGEPIGLLLVNSPQFVIAFYGILKAGGVVVAMNPAYLQRELAFQINDSGINRLFCEESRLDFLNTTLPLTSVKNVVFTSDKDLDEIFALAVSGKDATSEKWHNLHKDSLASFLLAGSLSTTKLPNVQGEDVAIYQYSGGTTGVPKAAEGTHYNVVANTIQFRSWLYGLKEGEEVVMAAIPLFHVYGMVIALSMGIALGASIILEPNPRNFESILNNIQKYGATLFPGVPNIYNAINRHPDVQSGKIRLDTIKACISGSATLMKETKEKFETYTGGKLLEGYGLSEAPTATHCNPMMGENRIGSIGLPLPDVVAEIVSLEDGQTRMPVYIPGELIIKGPQIMRGYHNKDAETRNAIKDGWLYTGDVAYMDDDGYFYLVDRKKDVIKVGGLQVWPNEIEQAISEHPDVLEVGVVGVVHSEFGERVKAFVVKKPGSELTGDEVKTWCAAHLARFKVPSYVQFIDQLPRSSVGKVLRRELNKLQDNNN
jgi:long-chain acyl-CoA synthetase